MPAFASLLYVATVLLFAAVAVLVSRQYLFGTRRANPVTIARVSADIIRCYRFRDQYLLNDLHSDDAFLPPNTDRSGAFDALTDAMSRLSPDFAEAMRGLQSKGEAFLVAGCIGDDPIAIGGRLDGDELVLTTGPSDTRGSRVTVDAQSLDSLQAELAGLRIALDHAPGPMWQQDAEGRVIWANLPYLDLLERQSEGEVPGWPLPQAFGDQLRSTPSQGRQRRVQAKIPGQPDIGWHEVSCEESGPGKTLFTAIPCDPLVQVETHMREYLQITAKTFAALPIGLAVFDRRRRLVTFNPALIELTQLSSEFLISRPDLREFLDRLRDTRRMPEPRDYRSWREEVSRVEEGAENGTFHEVWEVADSQTFRVVGRPHPDGAIAFMFEDISAEMSLTRSFRAQIATAHDLLDTLPAAIAVFHPDGRPMVVNEPYRAFWGHDPLDQDAPPNLVEITAQWSAKCAPSGIWGDLRDLVGSEDTGGNWVEQVVLNTGDAVAVRTNVLRGRAIVVQFQPLSLNMTDPLAQIGPIPATPVLSALREAAGDGPATAVHQARMAGGDPV